MNTFSREKISTISIACPHCHIRSKYETGFIEDAIRNKSGVECVACFLSFQIIVMPSGGSEHQALELLRKVKREWEDTSLDEIERIFKEVDTLLSNE